VLKSKANPRAFLRGLNDTEIRREATRGMGSPNRSLRAVYTLAEEARRTNLEINKMFEEELELDELEFFRDLARKNLPKHQLDALLTSYHAEKAQRHHQGPRWGVRPDVPDTGIHDYQSTPPPYRPEERRTLASNPERANRPGPVTAPPQSDNQARQPPKPRSYQTSHQAPPKDLPPNLNQGTRGSMVPKHIS